jgi:outer membrane lipoprotein-sorting protein
MFFNICCFSAHAASGQDVFDEITKRYEGFDKHIATMQILQDTEVFSPAGPVRTMTEMFKKSDKIRIDSTVDMPDNANMPPGMGEMKTTIIYDGKSAWMIAPFIGKTQLPAGAQKEHNAGMDWWRSARENMVFFGMDNVDNIECYLLVNNKKAPGSFDRIWISKDTLALVRAELTSLEGKKMEMIFSDFQEVGNNWFIARKIDIYESTNLSSTTTIRDLRINIDIPDYMFDPDSVQAQGPSIEDMMKGF